MPATELPTSTYKSNTADGLSTTAYTTGKCSNANNSVANNIPVRYIAGELARYFKHKPYK